MASSSERTSLPFDLVEEILCRIPLEYLIRLQLVCKQWYSLFRSKRFIYRYSDLVQERFIVIDRMVRIINPVTQTRLILISPKPDEFFDAPWISNLLHCDGLLLLKFNGNLLENGPKLAVWNPILGQIKWIQSRANSGKNKTYGIGYNNVSRDDYKILRFFDGIYNPDSVRKESYRVNLEIYDLKSNSWSTVAVSLDWSRDPPCKGVSVNGNMYWKAHWNNSDPKMFIQSFDFSSQTFKPRSCLPFESSISDTRALSCFRRDRLSLLHQFSETKKIEVWVSNKVDEEVMSWNKYLSFAIPDLPLLYADQNLDQYGADPGYFIDKNDKIRVLCRLTDEGIVYEIDKDGIKIEVETVDFSEFFYGYVYVPSLVPLPI